MKAEIKKQETIGPSFFLFLFLTVQMWKPKTVTNNIWFDFILLFIMKYPIDPPF